MRKKVVSVLIALCLLIVMLSGTSAALAASSQGAVNQQTLVASKVIDTSKPQQKSNLPYALIIIGVLITVWFGRPKKK